MNTCKTCGAKLNQDGSCPACLARLKQNDVRKKDKRLWIVGSVAIVLAMVCAFLIGFLLNPGTKEQNLPEPESVMAEEPETEAPSEEETEPVTEVPSEEKPDTAEVESNNMTGTCGTNAQWSFDPSTGVLTITGSGAMDHYTESNPAPWSGLSVRSAVINGVTSIGNNAFFWHSSLSNVTIGSSVATIGSGAFYSCDRLVSITFPSGVKTIGEWSFWSCDSLTTVTMSSSVTTIGEGAFSYCRNLIDVHYDGSMAAWEDIEIGDSNEELTKAKIYTVES